MSELVNKVAEILNAPVDLVQRSAEARAAASGISVDDVLSSWAGGESVASSAPKDEAPVVEETAAEEVAEEAPVKEVIEEAPVEEIKEVSVSSAVTRQVTKSLSFANETMGIKINSENLLPKWLNFSFIINSGRGCVKNCKCGKCGIPHLNRDFEKRTASNFNTSIDLCTLSSESPFHREGH